MITFVDQPNLAVSLNPPAYVATYETEGGVMATGSEDFLTVVNSSRIAADHYYIPLSRRLKPSPNWVTETNSIFSESRSLTPDESKVYEDALSTILTPVGRNIFDL